MHQIPPQPAPTATSVATQDSISTADVELSLVLPETDQPHEAALHTGTDSHTAVSSQPSSNSSLPKSSSGHTSNHTLASDQSLIKAGREPTHEPVQLPAAEERDIVSTGHADIATTKARRVAFEHQPVDVHSKPKVKLPEAAEDEWTVIQSDGSDTEYTSRAGTKLGLVRVKSEVPQEELPQQLQGQVLPRAASPQLLPSQSLTGSTTPVTRKLATLKVPLTGMGRPRMAARRGTPRFVGEGSEEDVLLSTDTGLALCTHSSAACWNAHSEMLEAYIHAQPTDDQEEEAASALRQHLSMAQQAAGSTSSSAVESQPPDVYCDTSCTAQHAQFGSTAAADTKSRPVAEGKESIAAFHPSWHLRANETAQSGEQPDLQAASSPSDTHNPLDQFYRPAGGLTKPPQHQLSIAEQAVCLNFGSHVVSKGQLPEAHSQAMGQKSAPRERSAIDDAVLSSEDSADDYENENQAWSQTQATSEADYGHESGSHSRKMSHGSKRSWCIL